MKTMDHLYIHNEKISHLVDKILASKLLTSYNKLVVLSSCDELVTT